MPQRIDFLSHRIFHLSETLLNPGNQFLRVERFGQIIIGPHLKTFQTICLVGTVGQEENQHMPVMLPNLPGHLIPIHLGHIDIQQHQVGLHFGILLQSNPSVAGIEHLISLGFQKTFQNQGIFQIVVCKKNLQMFHTSYRHFD